MATLSLVGICVILYLLGNIEGSKSILNSLYYSEFFNSSFHEIKNGQIWRIFTPSLLHGGILHLLFNILWLMVLGGMIERDKGALKASRAYFIDLRSSQYGSISKFWAKLCRLVWSYLRSFWICLDENKI